MKQSLHLLIVDVTRREALATWHDSRWMLPMLSTPERWRAGPAVIQWAAERGLAVHILGQWLGRAAPAVDALDWLVVCATTQRSLMDTSSLRWTPLECVRSSSALIEYQQWAIATATWCSDLPGVPGPFGAMGWLEEVRAWVGDSMSLPVRALTLIVAHRVSSYEVVIEWRVADRSVFFKGLASDRASEALTTSALAELAPDFFPRTISCERRADGSVWWLMEACAGIPLAQCLTVERAALVATAYAQLQQRVARASAGGRQFGMSHLELAHLAAWATTICATAAGSDDERAVMRIAIEQAVDRIGAGDVPISWVAADLDPANVLIDGANVRFIDLDDALIGPAALGLSVFARRLRRSNLGLDRSEALEAAVREAYECGWTPRLRLSTRWTCFDVVSRLLECHLAWQQVETKTRRGEIQGFQELAAPVVARRVLRALRAEQCGDATIS